MAPRMPIVGAKPPAASKTRGNQFFLVDFPLHLEFHRLAQLVGMRSIDSKRHGLSQEWIPNLVEVGIERYQAIAARSNGIAHQVVYESRGRVRRGE